MSEQLEFVVDELDIETKLSRMQHKIDAIDESMGKVRRRLFAQIGELQKLCLSIQQENQELRAILNTSVRDEWSYCQGDNLFSIHKTA